MAEALGLVASIIAVVQVSEAVIKACKGYIDSVENYPRDLRRVLLEVSSLKGIFDNLQFLHENDLENSPILGGLDAKEGAMEGCRRVILELESQFPKAPNGINGSCGRRRRAKIMNGLDRLAWPLKQAKVLSLLDELSQYKSTITTAFSAEIVHDVKRIHRRVEDIGEVIDDEAKRKFLKWLWHANPSSNHNSACGQHEPGTSEWVLQLPPWSQWLKQDLRCLWIHGIPGAGKTVLFSRLVGEIASHAKTMQGQLRTGCAYYYCYHARNHDETTPFLRWILGQLCQQAGKFPQDILENYHSGLEPSTSELLSAVEETLAHFDVAFISLDAVDESRPRDQLLRVISDLMGESRFSKLQLLVASREYVDIESTMQGLAMSSSISMANELLRTDIQIYVTKVLIDEKPFRLWAADLRDEVKHSLLVGAKGMFRWVICQIDLLRRMRLGSRSQIRNAISSLPTTLTETYERIFSLIPKEDYAILRSSLHWVILLDHLNAPRPSRSLSSLAMLVLNPSDQLGTSQVDLEDTMLDTFGCLIRIDHGRIVSLAHYTVREFLESGATHGAASYFAVNTAALVKEHLLEALNERPTIPSEREPRSFIVGSCLVENRIPPREILDIILHDDLLTSALFGYIISTKPYPSLNFRQNRNPGSRLSRQSIWICSLEDGEVDTDTHLFLSLLLRGLPEFLPKMLSTENRRKLYQQKLCVRISDVPIKKQLGSHHTNSKLTGHVFDVLAQTLQGGIFILPKSPYGILCEQGNGLFNPTGCLLRTLEHLSMSHRPTAVSHWLIPACKSFVLHGADCNSVDGPLTVLQLLVVFLHRLLDYHRGGSGVPEFTGLPHPFEWPSIMDREQEFIQVICEIILDGADPNAVGRGSRDSEELSVYLSCFQGQSPLRISRSLSKYETVKGEVEKLLIRAGGEGFYRAPGTRLG